MVAAAMRQVQVQVGEGRALVVSRGVPVSLVSVVVVLVSQSAVAEWRVAGSSALASPTVEVGLAALLMAADRNAA